MTALLRDGWLLADETVVGVVIGVIAVATIVYLVRRLR